MLKTESPWILSLQRDREETVLSDNGDADVVIIGGGASGMMAAYYLLRDTDYKVILLEKDRLSHGASGHNAGQAVAAFEVPYDELINRYGRGVTDSTYEAVNKAFDALHKIAEYAGTEIIETEALASFTDLRGAEERLRSPGSIKMYVPDNENAEGAEVLSDFKEKVWSPEYAAAVSYRAGILNCPVLLEKMAKRMLDENSDRFEIYEHSEAERIDVIDDYTEIKCNEHIVSCRNVIICTNGYPVPPVSRKVIDCGVQPVAGYIIGSIDQQSESAVRSYISAEAGEAYYYATRRPVNNMSLTCMGGLDTRMDDWHKINAWTEEDNRKCSAIETFMLQKLTGFSGPRNYQWKGLMGYTEEGVRIAGRDPFTPSVYYSLGCNGIGILPSIVSAECICRQMSGEDFQTTFFEPSVQHPEITGKPASAQLLSPPSRE